jgi:hypothetical protein
MRKVADTRADTAENNEPAGDGATPQWKLPPSQTRILDGRTSLAEIELPRKRI